MLLDEERLAVLDHLETVRHERWPRRVARRGSTSRPQQPSGGDNADVSFGYVAILAVELHFPEAGSLKGKRKHVLSAKAQLQSRFGASVAEVDHHELWQRSALTAAFVAREAREAERLAARAEEWLGGQEWQLVRAEVTLVCPDD
jgi:uncharacterized protein